MSRRARIEEMLASDPNDTFLRYSLAFELAKEGEFDRCLEGFRSLMSDEPPYVPAFAKAARVLVDLERVSEARDVLRRGIEAARRLGDPHAAGEMSEQLMQLGALGE